MIEPDYTINHSLVESATIVMGNLEFANRIREFARKSCNEVDLYSSQERFKRDIEEENGIDFYETYGDAINYIIENEYCNMERQRLPYLDDRYYNKFRSSTIMY